MTKRPVPVFGLVDDIGYWVRSVSNHASDYLDRALAVLGVTAAEWVILRELHPAKSIAPGDLAVHLYLTRGAITRLVTSLVRKRLIRQSENRHDRRFRSVTLTPAGSALVLDAFKIAITVESKLWGRLDFEESEALKSAIKAVGLHLGLPPIHIR